MEPGFYDRIDLEAAAAKLIAPTVHFDHAAKGPCSMCEVEAGVSSRRLLVGVAPVEERVFYRNEDDAYLEKNGVRAWVKIEEDRNA